MYVIKRFTCIFTNSFLCKYLYLTQLDLEQQKEIYWIENLHKPVVGLNWNREGHRFAPGIFRIEHVIRDLEPSDDYEMMVRVENTYGWSLFSDIFRFYTKKSKSPF